jgi:hypothetical protein
MTPFFLATHIPTQCQRLIFAEMKARIQNPQKKKSLLNSRNSWRKAATAAKRRNMSSRHVSAGKIN